MLPLENNKCSLCVYSSFIFLTNVFLALYYEYYLYAFLFLLLTITSAFHHAKESFYTNIIDKIIVYCVIFYGGFIFYSKYKEDQSQIIKPCLIILTFLSVVFLYVYGYLKDNYSFHLDINISQKYHSLVHLISSISHHIIIIL
jgi:hypothetical protein